MEKRDKPPVDAELKRRIEELIAYKGGGHNPDLVEDVVENALKLLHDVEDRGDVRVIQTAIRELRYAFKLFAPYANTRKVTIFGSARTQPSRTEYKQAVEFALAHRVALTGILFEAASIKDPHVSAIIVNKLFALQLIRGKRVRGHRERWPSPAVRSPPV